MSARRSPPRAARAPGWAAWIAAVGLLLGAAGRAEAEPPGLAPPPEPERSVRLEGGLAGPGGFTALRYVQRLGAAATIEPGLGIGATGVGAGLLITAQVRDPDPPTGPTATRRMGIRLYLGASFALQPREPERTTDVPRGTYVWADGGVYGHLRVGARTQLVAGVGLGLVVAAPDRTGIGAGDDDFDTVGLFGAASWWVKQGIAPGLWVGVQR